MTKKSTLQIQYSVPVEEYWDIPFTCVGRQEWFDAYFDSNDSRYRRLVISSDNDLLPVISDLSDRKVLGIDSETTGEDKRNGLDPWRPGSKMLMLQIGTADDVYIIQPELIPHFKGVLESRDILHIFQNGVYDWKWLFAKYKIHVNRIYDTMIAEQLSTAGLYGYNVGLLDLVRRHPPHRLISKAERKKFVTFAGKFTYEMLYYAARDVTLLFPVMYSQLKKIKSDKLEQVCDLEFRLIPCIAMMELGGVFIDRQKHELAIEYWERVQAALGVEILKVYNEDVKSKEIDPTKLFGGEVYSFKIKSDKQKLEIFKKLGFDLEDAQRDTLEGVDHRLAKLLVEYSGAEKITSTYGKAMLARINPLTNRLHPRWNQLGAGDSNDSSGKQTKGTIATGRIAGDFMQLPKDHDVFEAIINQDELNRIKLAFSKEIKDAGVHSTF